MSMLSVELFNKTLIDNWSSLTVGLSETEQSHSPAERMFILQFNTFLNISQNCYCKVNWVECVNSVKSSILQFQFGVLKVVQKGAKEFSKNFSKSKTHFCKFSFLALLRHKYSAKTWSIYRTYNIIMRIAVHVVSISSMSSLTSRSNCKTLLL